MQKRIVALVCAAVWFGTTAAVADEESLPAYKQYCACKELFGRTTLNLMSFNPATGTEQKIREIAKITGTAVYPAMQKCRKAIEQKTYAECAQVTVLAPAPLDP